MPIRCSANPCLYKAKSGFTIVELLVVIVVIGILATITIVGYSGITSKAVAASLQADLTGAKTKLQMYQVEYGSYPLTMSNPNGDGSLLCPLTIVVDNKYCIKASSGNSLLYTSSSSSTYSLSNTNSTTIYHVTESLSPTVGAYAVPLNPADWLTIGTQTWAKANFNVGVMLASGGTVPINNGIVQKWCFNNLEGNCTAYGGLYSWDEMMNYSTIPYGQPGWVQDICPVGSHVPTDNDWKILEMQLNMTQAQADATSWRGTDQGTQLKSGGSSGLNIPLAGLRSTDGTFVALLSDALLWSSSESSANAWYRNLYSGFATVYRNVYDKGLGISVRCIQN